MNPMETTQTEPDAQPRVTRNRRSPKYVQSLETQVRTLQGEVTRLQMTLQQQNQQFREFLNGEQRALRMTDVESLQRIADALYVRDRVNLDSYYVEKQMEEAKRVAAEAKAEQEAKAAEEDFREAERAAQRQEALVDEAIDTEERRGHHGGEEE